MSFELLKSEIKNPNRIYGLDVIRALAASLVVFVHGNFFLGEISPTVAGIPIVDGVDLFFVLSGFLIGGILLRGINQQEKIDFYFVKKFLIRRWFRTFPNYYLFLFINIFLIALGFVKQGFLNRYLITFFVFMQNFYKPYDFLYWESWSLSVEEWFYFLFPVMLLAGGWLLRKNKKILFLSCTLSLIIFSTAVRLLKAPIADFNFDTWDVWIRKLVICRFDSIGYGLLAAWLHFYFYNLWKKGAKLFFVLGIGLYIILLRLGIYYDEYFSVTWYFTLSAIAAMCLLPLAEQRKSYSTVFGKFITFISIISYAMYLSNWGVAESLIMSNIDYKIHPIPIYIGYWLFVIGFSACIYNYFEKPFTDLRERFDK